MSTMDPDVMDEGSKIEGNSICEHVRFMYHSGDTVLAYQPLVLGQEDCDPSIDLANSERHQHGGESWMAMGGDVGLEHHV